jgi:hypothetical protein
MTQRGEVASPSFAFVATATLWAQFHFGLSVRSVKVVRHKEAECFVRGLWKSGGLLVGTFLDFKKLPHSSQRTA